MIGSFWFNSFSAGGNGAAGDFELISTTVLGSATPSVTFSSLNTVAAAYKHLQIRMTTRSSTTYGDDVILRFNGDSGSNYSHHLLVGNGSAVNSYAGATQTYIKGGYTIASDATPSQSFGASIMDILDFSQTTKNKTTRNLTGGNATGGTNSQIQLWSGAWYSTSAVTSITLSSIAAANFLTGSRFSLYGLRG